MNNNRWLQALIILLVIIAATWIMGQVWMLLIQFASIILLFFLAWLLAFALSPLARRLQAWGVGQLLASLIRVLVVLGDCRCRSQRHVPQPPLRPSSDNK